MVTAELLWAETYPTSKFVQTAVNHTKSKLLNNGYPATWTSPARPQQNNKIRPDKDSLFTLQIPFLSDGFNYKIQEILEQNNIPARLVIPRGRTLLDLTKRKTTTHKTCKSNIFPAKEISWKSSVVCHLHPMQRSIYRHDRQTLTRSSTGALASNKERIVNISSSLNLVFANQACCSCRASSDHSDRMKGLMRRCELVPGARRGQPVVPDPAQPPPGPGFSYCFPGPPLKCCIFSYCFPPLKWLAAKNIDKLSVLSALNPCFLHKCRNLSTLPPYSGKYWLS